MPDDELMGNEELAPTHEEPPEETPAAPSYVTKEDLAAFRDEIVEAARGQRPAPAEDADEDDAEWFENPKQARAKLLQQAEQSVMARVAPALERLLIPVEADRMASQMGGGDPNKTARIKAELLSLSPAELVAIQNNPGLAKLVSGRSTPVPSSEGRGNAPETQEDTAMKRMFEATGGVLGNKKLNWADFSKAWKEVS